MSDNTEKVLGGIENHPSYGMLGFYRATSSGSKPLFGSSVKHRDTIHLRLKRCQKKRDLNTDWYFGGATLFEVEMSYSQFAELITSMNSGDGIPVTIRSTMEDMNVPDCPFEDKSQLHLEEFKERLNKVYQTSQNLIEVVSDKFSTKKTFNKADREEILGMLHKISMNIGCNQDFQLSQFQRQMEQTVSESKGEIESFFQNKMYQLAQQAFVEDPEKALASFKSPVEIEATSQRPRLKKLKRRIENDFM